MSFGTQFNWFQRLRVYMILLSTLPLLYFDLLFRFPPHIVVLAMPRSKSLRYLVPHFQISAEIDGFPIIPTLSQSAY